MRIRPTSHVLRRAAVALVAVAVTVPLIAARADAYIYWSMNPGAGGGRVGQALNTGTVANYTLLGGLFGATAMAVDSQNIYWGNGSEGIGQAGLDGSNVQRNFVPAFFTANAIAVDSTKGTGYIFWADQNHSQIGRATITNGELVSFNTAWLSIPATASSIVVDPVNKVVYWTVNLGPGGGTIGKVNEDGSGYQPYWLSQLFAAQGLTSDGTYLYWVNGSGVIGRVKMDGTGLIPNYITSARVGYKYGSAVTTPSPILVSGGYLYYADLVDGYLGRVPNVLNAPTATNHFIAIVGSATGLALDQLPTTPGPLPPPAPPAIPDVDVLKGAVLEIRLPRGIERSLLAKVEAFTRAADAGDQATACDTLTAYADQVEALAGKKIPDAPADGLLADIHAFRTTLGCAAT
jgi:hypothetical protein